MTKGLFSGKTADQYLTIWENLWRNFDENTRRIRNNMRSWCYSTGWTPLYNGAAITQNIEHIAWTWTLLGREGGYERARGEVCGMQILRPYPMVSKTFSENHLIPLLYWRFCTHHFMASKAYFHYIRSKRACWRVYSSKIVDSYNFYYMKTTGW